MSASTKLAARLSDIRPFQVMEIQTAARRIEAAGRSVIHMEIGEPDFPTPGPVVRAAQAACASGDIYYTSALGIAPLREAIAGFYATELGVPLDPARVIVTAGSSAALLLVAALLVDRDDEVLLTDPGYPCNRHFVRAFEGRPVAVPVGPEAGYQLDAAAVARAWGPRTRGALVATPSNPTGTTVALEELAAIGRAVGERGGWLVVDEIYQGLTYDAPPRSVLSVHDEAFVINSFSKFFCMTGWRLGWLVAPERYVRPLESLAQNLYISPSALAQRAALACFSDEGLAIARAHREEFRARRDYLLPELRRLGFRVPVVPQGGFYLYADCSAFSGDSHAFCLEALEKAAVAFTPGTDFGENRAIAHVRFAYTVDRTKLAEGVRRLSEALGVRAPARS